MATRLEYDEWGRMIAIREESATHANDVADVCKALQNEGITGTKEMRHLAEFPGFVIEQYCNLNGVTWDEWMQNPVHARRMLNDPDLAYFRVHRGTV